MSWFKRSKPAGPTLSREGATAEIVEAITKDMQTPRRFTGILSDGSYFDLKITLESRTPITLDDVQIEWGGKR